MDRLFDYSLANLKARPKIYIQRFGLALLFAFFGASAQVGIAQVMNEQPSSGDPFKIVGGEFQNLSNAKHEAGFQLAQVDSTPSLNPLATPTAQSQPAASLSVRQIALPKTASIASAELWVAEAPQSAKAALVICLNSNEKA